MSLFCVVHTSVLVSNWQCVFIEEELHEKDTGKCVMAHTNTVGYRWRTVSFFITLSEWVVRYLLWKSRLIVFRIQFGPTSSAVSSIGGPPCGGRKGAKLTRMLISFSVSFTVFKSFLGQFLVCSLNALAVDMDQTIVTRALLHPCDFHNCLKLCAKVFNS